MQVAANRDQDRILTAPIIAQNALLSGGALALAQGFFLLGQLNFFWLQNFAIDQ